MAKHTVETGNEAVKFIRENGYPKAELIGSLGAGKDSDSDIDIVIKLRNKKTKSACVQRLSYILKPEKYCFTDWQVFNFNNTIFGDINLFFNAK